MFLVIYDLYQGRGGGWQRGDEEDKQYSGKKERVPTTEALDRLTLFSWLIQQPGIIAAPVHPRGSISRGMDME
jgi:hypothetical protein